MGPPIGYGPQFGAALYAGLVNGCEIVQTVFAAVCTPLRT
jgi:hypothetical protein